MMKFLKLFFSVGFYLSCGWFTFEAFDSPPIVFVLGTLAYLLSWFVFELMGLQKDRQPMATAKSGGWNEWGGWEHPKNWPSRVPLPPPPPPPRNVRGRPFVPQPTPERRGGVGFLDLPRAWPDAEDAAGAGLAWARQGAIQEKQDLDRRAKSLSNFIGLSEAFERLDPVEQDLLRHQCEHMWSYSEVLGARIANWRDGGRR
jgi:hypothetical protein